MTPFFSESLWPGLLVWILLFISDYSLTIYCARLYQTRAKDKIAIEGSYELTPFYQRDIDALKRISPRFLFAICTASLVLGLIWFVASGNLLMELAYQFALGALILTQMAVHIRHLRAVALFRRGLGEDGVRGRIKYPRWLSLQISSTELWTFAAAYVLMFAITGSVFLLGGAFSCAAIARKHALLSRKTAPALPDRTATVMGR